MQTDWLNLLHLSGLTLPEKRKLVRALGAPGEVLRADGAAIEEVLGARSKRGRGGGKLKRDARAAEEDAAALEKSGARFIGFADAEFPPQLNEIADAPLGLFALGDAALLRAPQLAIVGSREPTPSGRRTTERFAAELARAGLRITSGMAYGIDHAAHRGCLEAGGGTIAVTANGVDSAYPRALGALHREIAERGLVVSEYRPGAPPMRKHFPRRNRIISGLALGVLVVEAGVRSGSLITARLAGEHGREVFAVPGSIHVEVSRGCHRLLRQGAKLVECCDDILEELTAQFSPATARADGATIAADAAQPTPTPAPQPRAPKLGGERAAQRRDLGESVDSADTARVHELIDYTPTAIDAIISQSGLSADKVSHILVKLELSGCIASAAGGYQRLPQ